MYLTFIKSQRLTAPAIMATEHTITPKAVIMVALMKPLLPEIVLSCYKLASHLQKSLIKITTYVYIA